MTDLPAGFRRDNRPTSEKDNNGKRYTLKFLIILNETIIYFTYVKILMLKRLSTIPRRRLGPSGLMVGRFSF